MHRYVCLKYFHKIVVATGFFFSVPAIIEAAGNNECKKHKEAQSQKRLEVKKKMIERTFSLAALRKKRLGRFQKRKMHKQAN